MNLEKLINMVVNQVVRRLVNLVVDRGMNFAAGKMKPGAEPTDEERARQEEARRLAGRSAALPKEPRDFN